VPDDVRRFLLSHEAQTFTDLTSGRQAIERSLLERRLGREAAIEPPAGNHVGVAALEPDGVRVVQHHVVGLPPLTAMWFVAVGTKVLASSCAVLKTPL
jgi:hypothetical protein